MQTKLILTKGSDSTVRIHILDEADENFSLSDFVSATFSMKASIEESVLIEKSGSSVTSTTTSEPSLRIKNTYVEIDISSSDTEDLDIGTYLADIVFTDSDGKEFVTDLFYTEICPRVSE